MLRWGYFLLAVCMIGLIILFGACVRRANTVVHITTIFDGLPITRSATIVITDIATLTSNEQGQCTFSGRIPAGNAQITGFWVDDWGIEYEGEVTVEIPTGGVIAVELPTFLKPEDIPIWHITILSLDQNTFHLPDRFSLPQPQNGVRISYITMDSQHVYSYIEEDQSWRPVWESPYHDSCLSLSFAIQKSKRIFPAQRTAFILVDKKHGWRSSTRSDFDVYPIDFFFEQTLSTLEAKRMLDGKKFDVFVSLGSYSTLLETLYELKDHYSHYVGIESGASEEGFFFSESLILDLFQNPSKTISQYAQSALDSLERKIEEYSSILIDQKKGASASWIKSSEVPVIISQFETLIAHLELMLSDGALRNALRGDLAHTLSWQTLCFDFPDYKDLLSWTNQIHGILTGETAEQGYAVFSHIEGFSYPQNSLVQQGIELCELLMAELESVKDRTRWVGYNEPLWSDGKKHARSDYGQSGGIGFWFPVSVRGGLWNVFDKEPYNLLAMAIDTRWLPFLKRLLLYDILPSPQWLILDKDGAVIPLDGIEPQEWKTGSVATLFVGFLDRSAIDRVWIQVGSHFYPQNHPKVHLFEDESSMRFYVPIDQEDYEMREVGYRVLLHGTDLADEGISGFIPPIVQPGKIIIYGIDGTSLIDAPPDSILLIRSDHKMRFLLWVSDFPLLESSEVFLLLRSSDGEEVETSPLNPISKYQGRVLMESELILASALHHSEVWETALCFRHEGKRVYSENPDTASNWRINIQKE